ncbi:MAG: carbohydrate binding domain-containing protein, partial [Armatimonadetes bacterium]|nr:carbohydrate binding domain-containing protein [Armatimonadota bacterium]
RVFLWPSGYHYTLTYGKRPDGTFTWDDRKRFEKDIAPHAVQTRDGHYWHARRSWLQGGETSCLCPGEPWTIDWFNTIARRLCERGADIVQVDQVVGGSFQWCYTTRHRHPPGPGPWMTDVFHRQLATMLEECRKVRPGAVVCFEEPNEYFLQQVALQDYRDTESLRLHGPPTKLASVFNYLYHEYLPTFQSNPRPGDNFLLAYCLVNGQIPHFIPHRVFGPGPALLNGGFEEGQAEKSIAGWRPVSGWAGKVYAGSYARDPSQHHSGTFSLRLENASDDDIVQVSQNVYPGPTLQVGHTYRLSAWLKTDLLAKENGIAIAALTSDLKAKGGWHIPYPRPGDRWSRGEVTFTLPKGTDFLRIMLHVSGRARLWVDDVKLEEVLPDGRVVEVMRPEVPREHQLMRQWGHLYHGEARKFLQLGRMLHPPRVECAQTIYAGKTYPAIMCNAYEAPDGSRALILVNATGERQTGVLKQGARSLRLILGPWEAKVVKQ